MLTKETRFLLLAVQFMAVFHTGFGDAAKYPSLSRSAAHALYQFTFNISKNLEQSGNYAFAPVSIFGTLTALEPALRGRSREQVRNALGLAAMEDGVKQVNEMLRSIYDLPLGDDSYLILRAQKLYVDMSLNLTKSYRSFVDSNPSLGLRKADFFSHSRSILRVINRFVSRVTRGGITHLLSEDMITSSTKLFLVEAFTLEAEWLSAFNPADTRNEPFTLAGGQTIKVATMRSARQSCYIGQLSYQFPNTALLMIPFKNSKLTMTIVMPGTAGNFAPLEEAGAARVIHQALNDLPKGENGGVSFQQCNVHLPKFEISSSLSDLGPMLRKLGIVDLFSQGAADFSGLIENSRTGALSITHAVHQTKVTVGEVGLKSSAATGVGVGLRSFNQVIVNRPFIFIIRHESTEAVLLYGKVENPSI